MLPRVGLTSTDYKTVKAWTKEAVLVFPEHPDHATQNLHELVLMLPSLP